MENTNEDVNLQNGTEVTDNTNDSADNTDTGGTEIDIDAEVKKATAPLYARMKKAEEEAREAKARLAQTSSGKPESKGTMSTTDLIAIMNAKVNEEDIGEVEEYARFKGISVAEALKTNVVKTLLGDKEEMRKVANATNTRGSRVGSTKISPSDLLSKARTGDKVDDFEALALARLEERKNANKR
mgnify:FL=1